MRIRGLRSPLCQQLGPQEAHARAHVRQALFLQIQRLRQELHASVVAAQTHPHARDAASANGRNQIRTLNADQNGSSKQLGESEHIVQLAVAQHFAKLLQRFAALCAHQRLLPAVV